MNYSVLIGLTLDGKIYMDEYMGVIEALIPPGSGQTAHAPCLLETDDGDLLAAWFCGSSEGSRDISIALSRLPHNSGAWLPPVIVSNDPMRSEQNPSLFKTQTVKFGSSILRSLTVSRAKIICSSLRRCVAVSAWTAGGVGPTTPGCCPRRVLSAGSRSRFCQTEDGSSLIGYAPIAPMDSKGILPPLRCRTIKEKPGAVLTCRCPLAVYTRT